MYRTSRCPRSRVETFPGVRSLDSLSSLLRLPVRLSTCWVGLLVLLGILAEMTGEAVSSAAVGATAASGHHYQVPRVMSSHNNNSFSSLPFTPSSTSSLSSSHHAQSQLQQSASHAGQAQVIGPASTAQTSSNNWQLNHLLAPSSGIGGGHRKLPVRTSNNVTVTRKGSNSNKYTNSAPPSATSEAVSLPIRHWWTAVFHHHGDQHNSLSRNKRVSDTTDMKSPYYHQCLDREHNNTSALRGEHHEPIPKVHTYTGSIEWVERVCNKNNLDERVQVLLEALPCPHHKVCQILSPNVLRSLARPPDICRQVARDLWKNLFHKLFLMIRDFSDVFQQKLDLGQYNSLNDEENIQRCKDAYTFWTCSTQLPLWLLNHDINKFVEVESCRSTCLLVEKKCPFLIKDSEDDMASGNPSFICKGENVPPVIRKMMPTPCCYTSLLEPLPGTGFSTGPVGSGEPKFCIEPDLVEQDDQEKITQQQQGVVVQAGGGGSGGGQKLEKRRKNNHNNNNSTLLRTPDGGPVGIFADTPNADLHDLTSPEVKIASSSLPMSTMMTMDENPQQTCDKLLWPRDKSRMARLNVTLSSDWKMIKDLASNSGNDTTSDNLIEFSKESFDDGADNLVLALAQFFGFRQFYGDEQQQELDVEEDEESDSETETEEEGMADSQQAFTTNTASSSSSKLAPQFKFYAKGVTLTMWWILGLVKQYR